LLELHQEEATAIMCAAKRLSASMVHLYGTDGILLYQNNGVGSGQEVPHFHLHVVPRREGSDWGFGPPHLAKLNESLGPPIHNYAVASDDKIQTVEQLRNHVRLI
jgi:diadenosine tetraphosphate (Ap4A) HIT family hydrolase